MIIMKVHCRCLLLLISSYYLPWPCWSALPDSPLTSASMQTLSCKSLIFIGSMNCPRCLGIYLKTFVCSACPLSTPYVNDLFFVSSFAIRLLIFSVKVLNFLHSLAIRPLIFPVKVLFFFFHSSSDLSFQGSFLPTLFFHSSSDLFCQGSFLPILFFHSSSLFVPPIQSRYLAILHLHQFRQLPISSLLPFSYFFSMFLHENPFSSPRSLFVYSEFQVHVIVLDNFWFLVWWDVVVFWRGVHYVGFGRVLVMDEEVGRWERGNEWKVAWTRGGKESTTNWNAKCWDDTASFWDHHLEIDLEIINSPVWIVCKRW